MTSITDDLSERELIEQSRSGNREAFGRLVFLHRERLFNAMYALIGNEEESRDVSQEAFIRVFNSLDRFEIHRPFYPWLYRIARNLALDYLKKHGSRRKVSLCSMLEDGRSQFESSRAVNHQHSDVRDQIYQEQITSGIRTALDRLKPEFSEVIMMKHLQNLSYEEMADILNIPAGTVMSRLFHARKALAAELAELGYAPSGKTTQRGERK
ncbi:MAG: sigma-70 family RNA polymerase sigma factor [Candidatus Sumerlaeia bacterium]|nr:sigma-70 family RNA polymerase sigma factor [Candidatus Sumerlaeia bacterium]